MSIPLLLVTACIVVAALPDSHETKSSCLLQQQTHRQKVVMESPQDQSEGEEKIGHVRSTESEPLYMGTLAKQTVAFFETLWTAWKPNSQGHMQKTKMNQDNLPKNSRHIDKETWTSDWSSEYPPYVRSATPIGGISKRDGAVAASAWPMLLLLLALLCCLIIMIIPFLICACGRRKKKQETDQPAPVETISAAVNAPREHVFIPAHDALRQEPQTLSPRHQTFNRSLYAPMSTSATIYENSQTSPMPDNVAVDTTDDGHANYVYSGVDRDHDGIPDAVQVPHVRQAATSGVSPNSPHIHRQSPPTATAFEEDTTGDGHANYIYAGVDQYHHGIPDALQVHHVRQEASSGVLHHSPLMSMLRPPTGTPHISMESPPTATVGVDITGGRHATYIYASENREHDGIPDALHVPHVTQAASSGVLHYSPLMSMESPHSPHISMESPPAATVGVDITGGRHATYIYASVDRNHDGIPDSLQVPHARQAALPGVLLHSPTHARQAHPSEVFLQSPHMHVANPPTATVAVDTTGDGHANYIYAGVDRNHDGIPDSLQVPHVRGTPAGSFASPAGYSLRRS